MQCRHASKETLRQPTALLAAMGLLLFTACGQQPASSPISPPSTAPPESSSATASTEYREVEFTTRDDQVRSGRLFGDGRVGIVLSHMWGPGHRQDDWTQFATQLADRGYMILTYDERPTIGSVWQDVLGGADELRRQGATIVIAGGASLGAMASLHAAGQPQAKLDGVIWLAGVNGTGAQDRLYGFDEGEVAALRCPILFASGDQDALGAADDTRQIHRWAADGELLMLESDLHGTDILEEDPAQAAEFTAAVQALAARVAGHPAPC
jgi:predicted alpha/beta-hydrolase family hydrolase